MKRKWPVLSCTGCNEEDEIILPYRRSRKDCCDHCLAPKTRGLQINYEHLFPNCACCGSEDHALISYAEDEGNRMVAFEYGCPFIDKEVFDISSLRESKNNYWPDSRKIVEAYEYDPEQVGRAMKRLLDYGCGKHMLVAQKKALMDRTLRICEEGRAVWIFTRDINNNPRETVSESGLEFETETETETEIEADSIEDDEAQSIESEERKEQESIILSESPGDSVTTSA